jgi:tRNA dimethylallyltransferase
MTEDRPIILVLGPTAGGKTRLALDLANSLPNGGECISADSMQVYRGMDIGTAKPTAEERAQAPHHLLDIVDPSEDGFSVDEWLKLADRTIEDIRSRGKWPIVVGGTNLYIQALLHGLFEGPAPNPELRSALQSLDLATLRKQLEAIDPSAATRIHPNDRKRTIRAIEVFELTGQRISDLQTQWEANHHRCDVIIIGLDYPPEVINPRINARVKQMIDEGLVDEVRSLHHAGKLGTIGGAGGRPAKPSATSRSSITLKGAARSKRRSSRSRSRPANMQSSSGRGSSGFDRIRTRCGSRRPNNHLKPLPHRHLPKLPHVSIFVRAQCQD